MFKHVLLLASAVLIAVLASGCSIVQRPPSATPSATTAKGEPPQLNATPPAAATSTPSAASNPQLWHPGTFENGVQLYWHTTGSDETVQHAVAQSLDYIVHLGANSVGITFPLYTDGPTPSKVYRGDETPSPEQLRMVIDAAKTRHLRVMVRPLIDETNLMSTPGAWRGNIKPVRPSDWFASYRALLALYADAAARSGADEFVAGTELFSMQNYADEWQAVIAAISQQAHFTGTVSYSVNWDSDNNDRLPFTTIGLDAYPAIQLGDDATVEQLTDALVAWIDQQPESVRQRLTLQEVGIPAISGMYPHPWYWDSPGAQNLHVQANWFTAVYRAAKATGLRGVYYWMVDSNADPSRANPITDDSGSFIGRPAEVAIKTNFS